MESFANVFLANFACVDINLHTNVLCQKCYKDITKILQFCENFVKFLIVGNEQKCYVNKHWRVVWNSVVSMVLCASKIDIKTSKILFKNGW